MLREWGKMRTDHLTIEESPEVPPAQESMPAQTPLVAH
jgi:hypothetical protein